MNGGGVDGRDEGSATPEPTNLEWVQRAAELVLANEVLPGPTAIPDMARLRAGLRAPARRRRVTWAVGAVAISGAMAALAVMVVRPARVERPALSYVVEGAATVQGDSVEAPAAEPGAGGTRNESGEPGPTRLRFTDGTAVALDPGTRLRVGARTAAGANMVLDGGRVALSVVHRPGAAWQVAAGPFTVEVTGTRFTVAWDAKVGLKLKLEAGGVTVRGAGTGPGVTVRPGETLTGSAVDGRVTVAPTVDANAGNHAAPSADDERRAPGESAGANDTANNPASPPRAAPARATAPAAGTPRARQERSLALATPTRGTSPDAPAPPMAAAYRPDLQPPSVMPTAPSLAIGGGGVFCTRERAGLGFEGAQAGVWVPEVYHLAFRGPRHDTTHSWCGTGSVRLDVNFNEGGRRNFMGRLPHQSGQVVFNLPRLMDFTDKTVSLHVFIDGPTDARVAAQLYVIHHGKWVNGPLVDHLVPRRWWTISHTFQAENPLTVGPPYPPGGTSLVTDCDRIALVVYSTGGPRTWTGAVYVDDVNWK